ncbi:cation transport protein-domain-containing protein [Cadophora sp. MPI-SDFR-AT-0126]|nr:cation transport protein-domain-containing protein [Leotiomycetes sp. MPI-SDFR-AT-0126]
MEASEIAQEMEEMEVAPPKPPSKSQLFFARCLARASTIKVKAMSLLPTTDSWKQRAIKLLPVRDFVTIHYFVFTVLSFLSGFLLWLCQGRQRLKSRTNFLDCMFFAVSAITDTGLTTQNVSSINTFQQALLCVNFILGSNPAAGVVILTLRIDAFEKAHCKEVLARRQAEYLIQEALNGSLENATETGAMIVANTQGHLPPSTIQNTWKSFLSRSTVGRNSTFHGLSRLERQIISCTEYDAIKLLRIIVIMYAFLLQMFGALILALYFSYYQADVIGLDGVQPWALGIFNAISAFNNAGMSLMNDSMMPFRLNNLPVTVMCFLMLAGNTAFPIFLRIILWTTLKCLPRNSKYDQLRTTITYILRYPRRVYTHLFPTKETLYLVGTLFFLNAVDFVAFESLSVKHPDLVGLSLGRRVLIGLFQSLSVRCSGFNIVTISQLSGALLILYVPMMYVSTFPVTILMRTSNVYEERSLGVYSSIADTDEIEDHSKSLSPGLRGRLYFLRQQVKAQLNYDIWTLFLSLVLISLTEGGREPLAEFPVFNVIFEVFSAYANVGLSLGVAYDHYSYCGSFHPFSKIVMLLLMIRGRHRPLPNAIDSAVQLPNNDSGALEEADYLERDHEREREQEELKLD